jgi:hypothetical protein
MERAVTPYGMSPERILLEGTDPMSDPAQQPQYPPQYPQNPGQQVPPNAPPQQPYSGAPGQQYPGAPGQQYPGAPGQPGQPGFQPQPPPQKAKSKRAIITLAVVVIFVAIVGIVGFIASRDDAKTAKAGDCVEQTGANDLSVVKCDDAKADFKVVGRVEDKLQSEASSTGHACDAFAETESSYWEGESGKKGIVLCLAPIKK